MAGAISYIDSGTSTYKYLVDSFNSNFRVIEGLLNFRGVVLTIRDLPDTPHEGDVYLLVHGDLGMSLLDNTFIRRVDGEWVSDPDYLYQFLRTLVTLVQNEGGSGIVISDTEPEGGLEGKVWIETNPEENNSAFRGGTFRYRNAEGKYVVINITTNQDNIKDSPFLSSRRSTFYSKDSFVTAEGKRSVVYLCTKEGTTSSEFVEYPTTVGEIFSDGEAEFKVINFTPEGLGLSVDSMTKTDFGVFKNNEDVVAGDIRYIYGRENAGSLIFFTSPGNTEDFQFSDEELSSIGYAFNSYLASISYKNNTLTVIDSEGFITSIDFNNYVDKNGLGFRENGETVKAGDIRFLYGRQNAGRILMYTQDGVTGSEEPDFSEESSAAVLFPETGDLSYAPLGFPFPNPFPYIPDGCVPALGQESTVETYPVFKYIQLRHPEMIITEEQWQQTATENNGHVPYYSSGNGSTTFRFPCLLHYFCATSDGQKPGKYEADGLPNIKGSLLYRGIGSQYSSTSDPSVGSTDIIEKGALFIDDTANTTMDYSNYEGSSASKAGIGFDAFLSNSIYGASDSVRPKTAYGTWIIKAYGAIPTVEEMTAQGIVQGVSKLETDVTELKNTMDGILDYVVERGGNITQWYEIYRSGKLVCGGKEYRTTPNTVTFLKAFKEKPLVLRGVMMTQALQLYDGVAYRNLTTTSVYFPIDEYLPENNWLAIGEVAE